jgi:hypothetical protein
MLKEPIPNKVIKPKSISLRNSNTKAITRIGFIDLSILKYLNIKNTPRSIIVPM